MEPGAFRTGFANPEALHLSSPIPAYADVIGGFHAGLPESDGNQPGDPAKVADAILRALAADPPPLRLALGNDAAGAIAAHLDDAGAEFRVWEPVTRGTDLDGR